MSKNKGSKKNKPSPDLLDTATVELKRFRRFAKQVRKLSNAQKVVGSLGLLAADYAFLATRTPNAAPTVEPAADKPDLSGPDTTSNPVSSPSTPKPNGPSPPEPASIHLLVKSAHENRKAPPAVASGAFYS